MSLSYRISPDAQKWGLIPITETFFRNSCAQGQLEAAVQWSSLADRDGWSVDHVHAGYRGIDLARLYDSPQHAAVVAWLEDVTKIV